MPSEPASFDEFSTAPVSPEDLATARFAAVRAALDPTRRAMQHDVLVDGVVEILYRRPDQSVDEVLAASRYFWANDSLRRPLIERALEISRQASLAAAAPDLAGTVRWRLTETARLMAEASDKAGRQVLTDFLTEIGQRLESCPDDRVDSSKRDRVAFALIRSIAHVVGNGYAVSGSELDAQAIRPLRLDGQQVAQQVSSTISEPKSLRLAALEILIDALDPDDQFGNEVVRLLTVSNILYGFANRRDLPSKPDLSKHRIALDTSTLVGLASPQDSTERKIVEDVIRQTVACGVAVVVTEHVLAEWDRLWDGARTEHSVIDAAAIGANGRLLGNPFVRQYLSALEDDARLEWSQFERRHRDIRAALTAAGVTVRPSGNKGDSATLAAELGAAIFERRRDSGKEKSRSNCNADGESLAMVHRWRQTNGSSSAYFVSIGTFPGRVYADITGERDVHIEITAGAWLLYLATISTDDPTEQSRVAELVADSTIRSGFFGMAVSYTSEEVAELSKRLCDLGGPPTIEDSRAALQLDLLSLFDEVDPESLTLEQRISAVVQRRQLRTTTSLARRQANLDHEIDLVKNDADTKVAIAADRASRAEEDADLAKQDAGKRSQDATFWKRIAIGSAPAVLAAAIFVVACVLAGVPVVGWAIWAGATAWYGAQLIDFAGSPELRASKFVARALTELGAVAVLEVGISLALA